MLTRAHRINIILLAILLSAPLVSSQASSLSQANEALQRGRVDEATAQLQTILANQPGNAQAHQLLCRSYYAQDLADPSIHECELAVANAPNDSANHLWLGRAYGLKASHAGPFTALGLAKKVRSEFEQAVAADPNNIHAASDLGEFYIGAPGIVGGGVDKAEALAARIQPRFPAQAHRLQALIALKKKDSVTAESEFKAAANASRSPEAYIDLASFYQRHDNPDLAVATIKSAIAADSAKDDALVDAASILTSAHRSPELAERLLREYLVSPARSDATPAFKVHLQLGDLLDQRGDHAAAHNEYAAALALASNFAPARKALQTH